MKRREQITPSMLGKYQYGVHQIKYDERDHNVLHPNLKFASSRSSRFSMMPFLVMTQ
jgi:hypothetical protein